MEIKSILGEKVLIEWRKMESLQPDNLKMPYNIGHLKKSLLENNFAMPFFGWQNGESVFVIDGHQRREVLSELESEGVKVPELLDCQLINAKDRQEAIKLLLSVFNSKSNPIDLEVLTEWIELEQVEVEITSLNVLDVNEVEDEIQEILEAEEDDFDSTPPETPETVLGDLYEIGEHRLLCGDSTDSDQVAKLMNGSKADMVFTDPPYGVAINNTNGKILGDEDLQVFDECLPNIELFSKEDSHIYIYFGVQFISECVSKIKEYFKQTNILIQRITHENKPSPEGYFKNNYEVCYFSNKGKKKFNSGILEVSESTKNDSRYKGDGFLDTYLALNEIKSTEHNAKSIHPTQKTIEICSFYQKVSSNQNDLILDLFLGSGSTMVASHQLKRKCYGMELDPKYCDVIVKRMIKLDSNLKVKRNGIDETKKWLDKIK